MHLFSCVTPSKKGRETITRSITAHNKFLPLLVWATEHMSSVRHTQTHYTYCCLNTQNNTQLTQKHWFGTLYNLSYFIEYYLQYQYDLDTDTYILCNFICILKKTEGLFKRKKATEE